MQMSAAVAKPRWGVEGMILVIGIAFMMGLLAGFALLAVMLSFYG